MSDVGENNRPALLVPTWCFFALGFVLVFSLILFMPLFPSTEAEAHRMAIWNFYVVKGRQTWGGEAGGEAALAGLPPLSTVVARHLAISLLGGAAVWGAIFLALNKARAKGRPSQRSG